MTQKYVWICSSDVRYGFREFCYDSAVMSNGYVVMPKNIHFRRLEIRCGDWRKLKSFDLYLSTIQDAPLTEIQINICDLLIVQSCT